MIYTIKLPINQPRGSFEYRVANVFVHLESPNKGPADPLWSEGGVEIAGRVRRLHEEIDAVGGGRYFEMFQYGRKSALLRAFDAIFDMSEKDESIRMVYRLATNVISSELIRHTVH